jgi:hypothetical protein
MKKVNQLVRFLRDHNCVVGEANPRWIESLHVAYSPRVKVRTGISLLGTSIEKPDQLISKIVNIIDLMSKE